MKPPPETPRGGTGEVHVFHEDRDDVTLRVLPRLAGANFAIFLGLGVAALVTVPDEHQPTLLQMSAVVLGLWWVSLLVRIDLWTRQLGRRVRYEISETDFRAFVGRREKLSFKLDEVKDWTDCGSSPRASFFTLSSRLSLSPARYTFTLGAKEDRWAPFKQVIPPGLFRWEDRGGLEDVSRALRGRLGDPL